MVIFSPFVNLRRLPLNMQKQRPLAGTLSVPMIMAGKQKKCHLHFCKWHFGTL